jgi:hypothetical protein
LENLKEIKLRIKDSAFETVYGFIKLCPAVEVISTGESIEIMDETDRSFANSMNELKARNVFITPADYAYIMKAANDEVFGKSLFFFTPSEFIGYLELLGLKDLVSRSTLYKYVGNISGKYPNWGFADSDKVNQYEILRRKNIVIQFLSAFLREKRRLADAQTDK